MTLTESSKAKLIAIARKALEAVLAGQPPPPVEVSGKEFEEQRGVFVTLKKGKDLRGCMGCFSSTRPLAETVQEMALSSALHDPRFPSLIRNELRDVTLEISILSPLWKIREIDEIVMGEHGILIEKEGRSGCFLPQVAEETGWTREQFLGHCARDKAGLGWEGWKNADISVFTVESIEE